MIAANPDRSVTVDLERQIIACGNREYAFSLDPVSRNQLINGWDDIDLTESYRARISVFVAEDGVRRPWAVPARAASSS
jgi:3-isopropylmalate/(R)-2-methylmalate dehydratase small subunit